MGIIILLIIFWIVWANLPGNVCTCTCYISEDWKGIDNVKLLNPNSECSELNNKPCTVGWGRRVSLGNYHGCQERG